MTEPRIIVALDLADTRSALALACQLPPSACRVKVGKELFTRGGPALVRDIQRLGLEVFLDLKFHDIPNTVAGACAAAADLGVWMVNVHASGGRRMLLAAREGLERSPLRPRLVAVTVLTSLERVDLVEVGIDRPPQEQVRCLAALAQDCGLDGVVCSPREVAGLRRDLGPGLLLVTPGVRLPASVADDQRRVMTPIEALAAGADYLVIGRPITAAPDPALALEEMAQQLSADRFSEAASPRGGLKTTQEQE
jgi:orotidine-5'-phosphate decarboxylase